jgi:glycosyltransferase involved in cell wall biosynthesis
MAKNTEKKILLIIPNLGRGGAQKVFHQQFLGLAGTFKVMGCVFNFDEAFPEDQAENILSLNVPKGKNFFTKFWNFILRVIRLRKLKKQYQIDVSISHLEGADYVNILSRRNDKVICWIHGTKKYDENISGLLGLFRMKFLLPVLYKNADQLVTVSQGIAQELSVHLKAPSSFFKTIYNGFDSGKITSLCEEGLNNDFSSLFKKSKIVITHCRLSRQKNLETLLFIFSKLSHRKEVKLIILGDGELRNHLIGFSRQQGLITWSCWDEKVLDESAEVYFIGQQQNPFKFLGQASIYVMTSDWEGFPLALCEAMAIGLPVIAPDCHTGPREIIAPEITTLKQPVEVVIKTNLGTLMPLAKKTSAQLWASEIDTLINELGANGKQNNTFAVDRIKEFSDEKMLLQTTQLIRELIK